MHQILPLGTNATVHCLPEPIESRPAISWTVNGVPYQLHTAFYNSMGIAVHLTADNISFVVVEGRQEHIDANTMFVCAAPDESLKPVASGTAVVEFYGKLVSVVFLGLVFSLLVLVALCTKLLVTLCEYVVCVLC